MRYNMVSGCDDFAAVLHTKEADRLDLQVDWTVPALCADRVVGVITRKDLMGFQMEERITRLVHSPRQAREMTSPWTPCYSRLWDLPKKT